jgi:hypothetical protein
MTYIADDILLERMDQKETALASEFDTLESRASYLLAIIAVLAGIPPVFSEKGLVSWGEWALAGHIVLFGAALMAVLAAAAVFWVFSPQRYRSEETEQLVVWRDQYVAANAGYPDDLLFAELRKSLIASATERIAHNQELNDEKGFRLQTAYLFTIASAALNLILLLPVAARNL